MGLRSVMLDGGYVAVVDADGEPVSLSAPRCYTYFIRAEMAGGPIKIGSSLLPEKRLRDLMQWSPVPLRMEVLVAGDRKLERQFHERFSHLHSHREWFRPGFELERCIAELKAGAFDFSALGDGADLNRNERLSALHSATTRLGHARRRGIIAPPHIELAAEIVRRPNDPRWDAAIAEVTSWLDLNVPRISPIRSSRVGGGSSAQLRPASAPEVAAKPAIRGANTQGAA